jgi:hypothetical protein
MFITEQLTGVRGDLNEHEIKLPGKHDDRVICFTLKKNQNDTVRLASITTPSQYLTVTYNADTNITALTITLLRVTTEQLASGKYWYDVTSEKADDSEDHKTVARAPYILENDVARPSDETAAPDTVYTNQVYDAIAEYVIDADGSKLSEKQFGWDKTFATGNVSTGHYYLTSDADAFDENTRLSISKHNPANFNDLMIFEYCIVNSKRIEIVSYSINDNYKNIALVLELKRVR